MADKESITETYLAHRHQLERFLTARTGNAADAEEILQDVWIKLATRPPSGVINPISYLFRMSENAVCDRLRAQIRSERGNKALMEQAAQPGDLSGSYQGNAEQILVSKEELCEVEKVIDKLPERTAYLFRSVRIEKRRQKDLANELEISVSAVEKHLQKAYRAVLAVRQKLDAEFDKI